MKTILITGASGFLGSNCAEHFYRKGFKILGLDIFPSASQEIFAQFILSPLNQHALKQLEAYDYVIHCAGGSSVGLSYENLLDDFHKTVESTAVLLDHLAKNKFPAKIIYPSSAGVYGNTYNLPIQEEVTLAPISPYGLHKKLTEEMLLFYNREFGTQSTIIRFFSLYGNGLKKQVLWDICNKIYSDKHTLEFFGTGDESRDFIHIDDALIMIESLLDTNNPQILNGGGGKKTTIQELVQLFLSESEMDKNILFNDSERTGDPKSLIADTTLLEKYSLMPAVSIREGIHRYHRWFTENCL